MPSLHFARTATRSSARLRACLRVLFVLSGLLLTLPLARSAPAQAQGEWSTECVDCPKYFSFMTDRSLRLDPAGHPHIAYGGDALYYAWYDGDVWHVETVDNSPKTGTSAALALDGSGYAHISYADDLEGALKYAYQDASGWNIETVDSDPLGVAGVGASLALDGQGYAHISYGFSNTNTDRGSLRYAYQDGAGWHVVVVDEPPAPGDVGYDTSLALDSSGHPHISYDDFDVSTVKYAYMDQAGSWHTEIVDPDAWDAGMSSIVVDAAGYPHISYNVGYESPLPLQALGYAYQDAQGWHREIVDSSTPARQGQYSSLALDGQGHPHISYRWDESSTVGQLKYAYFDGANWQTMALDAGGGLLDNVLHTSLALTEDGYPSISCYDATNGVLRYSFFDGSSWTNGIGVDSGDLVGEYNSLALDASGYGHIAYYARIPKDLRYAYQDSLGWHTETVDPTGDTGWYPSIAIDASGRGHISYRDRNNLDNLMYAYQDESGWHAELVDTADGCFSSLVLDTADYPHVSYGTGNGGTLKYAYQDASGWHTELVEAYVGFYVETSLALDQAGYPHIAYYANDPDHNQFGLHYAYKGADGWHYEVVESVALVGRHPSLALDSGGQAYISYLGGADAKLRYARRTGPNQWVKENVDSGLGSYDIGDTSLALAEDGNPRIGYFNANTFTLKYAYKDASGWHLQEIAPHARQDLSLALDKNGNPHISYHDYGTGDLKVIAACTAVTGISVSGPVSLLVGEEGTYSATYSPSTATLPVTIAWDNGTQGETAVYSWDSPGNYTLAVSAHNCGGEATTTYDVTVSEPPPVCPQPLTGVTISGADSGYTDTPYSFTAAVQPPDATTPITYTWSPEPDSGQGTATATYSWSTAGSKWIAVNAENCGGVASAMHRIVISEPPPDCIPLTGVTVGGPDMGYTGTPYAFNAAIEPVNATTPITYAWSPEPGSGQGTTSATYTWTSPGPQAVMVTAVNCGGPVNGSHTITVWRRVFLPVVVKRH